MRRYNSRVVQPVNTTKQGRGPAWTSLQSCDGILPGRQGDLLVFLHFFELSIHYAFFGFFVAWATLIAFGATGRTGLLFGVQLLRQGTGSIGQFLRRRFNFFFIV